MTAYGLSNSINIQYGQKGFPPWVYELCRRFELEASTYPFHQDDDRPDIGAAPNPERLNRGIDWRGEPQAMLDFARWLRDEHPAGVEMVIHQDGRSGECVGFPIGVDYDEWYSSHTDHVHTRISANPIEGESTSPPREGERRSDRLLLEEVWAQLRGTDGKGLPQFGGRNLVDGVAKLLHDAETRAPSKGTGAK